jgi:DNA-binding SARP family transcriptional activator
MWPERESAIVISLNRDRTPRQKGAPMRLVASEPQLGNALEIRLLGPFEVCVGGRPAAINGSKRRAVLAMLAQSAGRVVPLETLMGAVWRSAEPAAPRNAVQHHITRLRAELGPDSIVAYPDGYALGPARVDALVFEELLAAARSALRAGDPEAAAESITQALGLFRGQPLQGLPDTEWVCAEGARLEDARLDALEEHFEAALAQGRHAEIVSAIGAAIDETPFRERLHGQLMLALYRCGRQADALDAFQQARHVLSEQLGLDPGPELRRLERAILAHDPCIDVPVAPGIREDAPGPSPLSLHHGETLTDVLQLMRAHLRRAEELYAQAVAAAAV